MNIKALLICHLLIALLIASLFCPFTQIIWDQIDLFFFRILNEPLRNHPNLQFFWAFANHKWADWLEDLVVLVFFFFYVKLPSNKTRTRRCAELLFSSLYIAFILFFINRILFRETLTIYRDSPTLILDNCVHLSDQLPWIHIKDSSPKCFPADHATTAILFACTYCTFVERRSLKILAILYAIFLCLPRMVTGAHWLSDIIVGSGSIVLFCLGWAFLTPFHRWFIDSLEKFFLFLKRIFKSNTRVHNE
jgi:Kdo2-lipid A phosphotransferase